MSDIERMPTLRPITLRDAKREIYFFALKIHVGVVLGLWVLSRIYILTTNHYVPAEDVEIYQGNFLLPLYATMFFFIPFSILTAHKRWIWSDAKMLWKYPGAAIQKIRDHSKIEEKRERQSYRDTWADVDKSLRILPDYITARTRCIS